MLELSEEQHCRLLALCSKWHMSELSMFGSAIRDDFRADSDVDLLVEFESRTAFDWDTWMRMEADFEQLFERPVDIVERRNVRNPIRLRSILNSRRVVHAAV